MSISAVRMREGGQGDLCGFRVVIQLGLFKEVKKYANTKAVQLLFYMNYILFESASQ